MSSIKQHPQYPFVRIGLAYDFHPELSLNPEEHIWLPDDWIMVLGDSEEWGCCYDSEEHAMRDVENVIFSEWHTALIESQLILAQVQGMWDLALRLAEKRGFAAGYKKANAELISQVDELKNCALGLAQRVHTRI